jgi:RluA family pseudouridine synthase
MVDMHLASPEVLFLDNHLLVLKKPCGFLSQSDGSSTPDLLQWGKHFLKEHFQKPGQVFLGLVHRLDRDVSGVMVFARTSKAAGRLSAQWRQRLVVKEYKALVEGLPPERGSLRHWLLRGEGFTRVVAASHPQGQMAALSFVRGQPWQHFWTLHLTLETGRRHQIRVQLSHEGYPILGDFRYGATSPCPFPGIALHAHQVTLTHPTTQERLTFQTDAPWMTS